ncbi:MAG: SRPBCC family protein [Bacteroidales bacterium]|nr:SRPBCC family protein [Bacteroidales bacterium]
MKTIKILTGIITLIIVGALSWALFLPSDIHIKQSVTINAPIGVVFNQINDLHNWNNWSPWKDTTLSAVFKGKEKGVGAKVVWTDKKEGESILTIVESEHFGSIKTLIEVADQDRKAEMNFTFEENVNKVTVYWERHIHDLSYPFGRFVGWMLQKGYEHNFALGLNHLKSHIEQNEMEAEYHGYEIIESTFNGGTYLASNASSTMDSMSNVMGKQFGAIMHLAINNKLQLVGAPMVQWHSYHPEAESQFTCLIPIQFDSTITAKNVYTMEIPTIKTLMVKYVGPYEGSYNAWVALDNYVVHNSLIMDGDPWEEYITDPGSEPDSSKWVTNIYFPVK